MNKPTLSKDWIRDHGEKVKKAYSIAISNQYDIKSIGDVIKILKLIDPRNTNESYAKKFSKTLQLFDKTVLKKLNKSMKPKKPKTVN